LTIDLLNAGETSEITIADMMGRVVWTKATNASLVTVPTSDFTKGLYIIRINRGKVTAFKLKNYKPMPTDSHLR
jgi:ABC-type Fe3+-hydroxamate transport system substrate-binding protein